MNKLKKIIINLIPSRKWRGAIKYFEEHSKFDFFEITIQKHVLPDKIEVNNDIVSVYGVNFKKMKDMTGLIECFFLKCYEYGCDGKSVFIDLGANIADSSLFAAVSDNCEKVYAYEPVLNTYKQAQVNIGLNPELSKKIELANFGWGGVNQEIETDVFEDINLSTLNSTNIYTGEYIPEKKIKKDNIKIKKEIIIIKKASDELKKILEKHPESKIVLKADIEGGEYECIKELDNSGMLRYIDVIMLEWHYKGYTEIVKTLEKNNYIWFNSNPTGQNIGLIHAVNTKKIKYSE